MGATKLKPGNVTLGREETDLSIVLITLFSSFGVVGADAAPVNSGRANSAPTTMKAARTKYKRGSLQKDLGFEGEALIILGILLED